MMRIARRWFVLPACAACLLSAGCLRRIDPPKGYVPVEDPGRFKLKAVSAQGTVFALRQWSNPGGEQADLSYWTQAVEHEKVDVQGYKMRRRGEIETTEGRTGTLFEFETGSGQGMYLWLVALFVSPTEIAAVEAGGPASQLEPDSDKIRGAIKTFR